MHDRKKVKPRQAGRSIKGARKKVLELFKKGTLERSGGFEWTFTVGASKRSWEK